MFNLKRLFQILVLAGLISLVLLYRVEPKLESNWTADQATLASAEISGDEVKLTQVRNFIYRSESDYTPAYYDTAVRLSDLERVDYIVEPFGDLGAAHTFVTFVFADGQYISISVETRREVGEKFSPLLGLLRQYELVYIIANEKDAVGLRANYRHDIVYLYPTTLTVAEGQQLFVDLLERANKLRTQPEFYNTVNNNCTTNIADYVNEIRPQKIFWDYRLVLTGESDALALELGLLDTDLTLEEARAKYKINGRAAQAIDSPNFSQLIRQTDVVGEKVLDKTNYQVSRIIDGDTIDVLDSNGEVHRVRYIGMDTPEMNYDSQSPDCLATEARDQNAHLVEGKSVQLIKDISDTDKYGRWLRYVVVDGVDVGQELLLGGYARVLPIPPNKNRLEDYKIAEMKAKNQVLGIWSKICVK